MTSWHQFSHPKIKRTAEIAALVGRRPRTRTVALCHGVFDIVHPGHVRHLTYAKSRADILIASLTADRHVTKGDHRPFVPEAIRAYNLAALEAVDYVVIDPDPTPLASIALIQPDLFAKGYEYCSAHSAKTAEEQAAVESYGGAMLFTPGDVIYSSSQLIESSRPSLAGEKLLALLEAERLDFGHLRRALKNIAGLKVHVVGDTIVDSQLNCAAIGASSKTPMLSVRRMDEQRFVGGAAIVAKHLRAAGADVHLTTLLGDDQAGAFVLAELDGVHCEHVVEVGRPTTLKQTIVAGNQGLLKVDTVDNRPISVASLQAVREIVGDVLADILIFADFRHGIFNRETIPALSRAVRPGVFRVADSQVASRWGNVLDFGGFDLLTPNECEARFALGDQDSVVRPLGSELYRQARCGTLILKLGERGSLTFRSAPASDDDARSFFALDSFAGNVVDAVGSGDALLAYAAPSLFCEGNAVIASVLGSFAAAVECERQGNIPVAAGDVAQKLAMFERHAAYESVAA